MYSMGRQIAYRIAFAVFERGTALAKTISLSIFKFLIYYKGGFETL